METNVNRWFNLTGSNDMYIGRITQHAHLLMGKQQEEEMIYTRH